MTASRKMTGILLFLMLSACATTKAPTQAPVAESGPPSMSGKVVETMNVASYTYLELEDKGRKTWYAVPVTKVAPGETLTVRPAFEMTNFRSRELNRTFDRIYFSDGLVTADNGARAAALKKAHAAAQQGGSDPHAAAAEPIKEIKVEKASGPNAYTVAELYQKRDQLDKQGVDVRAQVVKVSKGVMGKNWLHLRDGSGNAAARDNDLVATTEDDAAVGQVIDIHGVVYKDKDFGAGYKYTLIMEEATIKR